MELFRIVHPLTGTVKTVTEKQFTTFIEMSKTAQAEFWLSLNIEPVTKPTEPEKQDSVAATLAQRGSRYGDFTDHAELCQHLKEVMMTQTVPENGGMLAWDKLSAVQKQALEVIADKIARILIGDPNYDDNWHDIQGYAKLVEDRLPKEKKES